MLVQTQQSTPLPASTCGNPKGQLPDLIYPEYRFHRIEMVKKYLQAQHVIIPETLHRVTLFTTYRCNLACDYCNTIRQAKHKPRQEYDFALFRRVLEPMLPYNVQHLHFTGGEATLVKDLPRMVKLVADQGVLCSITTNGIADWRVYQNLVEAGMREFRISCDTHIPEQFDATVHRRGAYHKVIETIRRLTRLREEGADIYIIINMCVGRENRSRLVEFVRQSIALQPDDLKLMPISQERGTLGEFEERHQVLSELEEFLEEQPLAKFPLLRRKLNTVFAGDIWGLKDLTSQKLMRHCFVPLTERTLDPTSYYPCPVYVREGGAPLGSITQDDFMTQQRKSFEFVQSEDCLDDDICQQYCIHCCKKFNLFANASINACVRGRHGEPEPIAASTHYSGEIRRDDVFAAMTRIAEERRSFRQDVPYRPFLVLKPGGIPYKTQILAFLKKRNIHITCVKHIPDWNKLAMRLYSFPLTESKVLRGILLARALPQIETTSQGELWLLDGQYSIEELEHLKYAIRALLPPSNCLIIYQDEILFTSHGYLHSPDSKHYWIEANLLCYRDVLD